MSTTQPPDLINKGGRPTCRTPETAAAVCKAIGLGVPFRHACSIAGISYSAFAAWKKEDEQFCEQVENALASGVQRRLEVIEQALESQDPAIKLRAACWWLEHRLPEHFSKSRLEISGPDGESLAGTVAIFLPQKDGSANAKPVVSGPAIKEIKNEH